MNVSGEPLLSPIDGFSSLLDASKARQRDEGKDVQLFAYGRQALAAGMRNMPPGTLLAPAFICDTAVDALPLLGHPVRFYPVRDDLSPDWEWLDANREPDDSAFLLVHYFGFPNDLNRAEEFCRYASLSLIEDCAHSFLSQHEGQPLGSTGAFAIFSYRKMLPVRTGAGYYSAAGDTVPEPVPDRSNSNTFVLRQILKWAVFKSGSGFLRRQFAGAISDERDQEISSTSIDPFSRVLMNRIAPRISDIRERRRQNYQALILMLGRLQGITLVRPRLGVGDCPWAFPLLIERREALLDVLRSEGVGAWVWPSLPEILPQQDYVHEVTLARQMLLLPVHQDLRRYHIEFIADTVTAWALSNG